MNVNEQDKAMQAEPVGDHSGLINRIDAAIERVTQGRGLMSIPADPRSDVDLVLSECKALLQGENPPFWAKDFHPTPAVAVNEQMLEALKVAGLFIHHCWCDVQMNDYSFEKLENALHVVDTAIAAAEAAKKGGV